MGWFDFLKRQPQARVQDARLAPLLAALADSDPSRRIAACDGLGRLGRAGLDAVPALEEALMDDDNKVCEAAARAVNDIRRAM